MTKYVALLCRGKYIVLPLLLFLCAGTVKTGTLDNAQNSANAQNSGAIEIPAITEIPGELFKDYRKTLYDVIETYRGALSTREIEIIILTESHGLANAVSSGGESYGVGLMQISGIALKEFNQNRHTNYKIEDLYDPFLNVEIGCWILNDYYKAIKNPDIYKVYNAYNVGLYNHRSHYAYYQNHKYPDGKSYNALKRLEWAIDAYDNQTWRLVSD
ncbi:MAG: transglycosylase SLT domain-containing protein [Spirochaetaceae bacterium]|nr:transglycosylase SLT domain-containing protein [Spirochaetaceae bacterium]